MRKPLRQRRSAAYDHGHAFHLAHGHAYFDDQGWGPEFSIDGYAPRRSNPNAAPSQSQQDAVLADMRRAWSVPAIREAAYAERRRVQPFSVPVAYWVFEATQPRDKSVAEWLQLHRVGAIDLDTARSYADAEVAEFKRTLDNPYQGSRSFRRPDGWWFLSATPRDVAKLELCQLVAMHKDTGDVLTPAEQLMLSGDQEALRGYGVPDRPRFWQRHLTDDERRLLGLPELDAAPSGSATVTDPAGPGA